MQTNKPTEPRIATPLKWHGGKFYLAERIVALMPPHLHYVEPYFGGGSVLLAKNPEGVSEVINDLDGHLMNWWRVLQDESRFAEFIRIIQAMPFAEQEWLDAHDALGTPHDGVVDAAKFFVECRQSLAGRRKAFAPLSKTRTRRGMNEQASAWLSALDGLAEVHARMRRVVILNRPALEVIQEQDGPDTLFYADPPYVRQTRAAPDVYALEMTDRDHMALLNTVTHVKGKVLLSGYRSDLYDSRLANWVRQDFDMANNASGGAEKRRMVECVWCNFPLGVAAIAA